MDLTELDPEELNVTGYTLDNFCENFGFRKIKVTHVLQKVNSLEFNV
jgi:hypothetical protein